MVASSILSQCVLDCRGLSILSPQGGQYLIVVDMLVHQRVNVGALPVTRDSSALGEPSLVLAFYSEATKHLE